MIWIHRRAFSWLAVLHFVVSPALARAELPSTSADLPPERTPPPRLFETWRTDSNPAPSEEARKVRVPPIEAVSSWRGFRENALGAPKGVERLDGLGGRTPGRAVFSPVGPDCQKRR